MKYLDLLLRKRFFVIFTNAVCSGIVFFLLVNTVIAYFKHVGLSLSSIGLSYISLSPYSLKFLWSSYIDKYKPLIISEVFGQYRAWILLSQIVLMIIIPSIGFIPVSQHAYVAIFIMLTLIGIVGATHDIAFEAYRIEISNENEHSLAVGAALAVYGFRIGGVISGIFGLFLPTLCGWRYVFFILSLFIIPCAICICFGRVCKICEKQNVSQKTSYKEYFIEHFIMPLKDILNMPNCILIIVTILFYKVSDVLLEAMSIPFLLEMGFSNEAIAGYAKSFGTVGVFIGTFIGMIWMTKMRLINMLFVAEICASATNLLFLILIYTHNFMTLGVVSFLESVGSSVANISLRGYMSALCIKPFLATHYAVFMSLSSVVRGVVAPVSGLIVKYVGWKKFFIISSCFSIPSVICIVICIMRHINLEGRNIKKNA